MFQIDAAGKAVSKPAYTPDGGAGWFQAGCPVTSEWLNHVQNELKVLLETAGVTLDKADDAQLVEVLKGAFGAVAHATDTGAANTIWTRLVLAAAGGQASGDRSLVAAANSCVASAEDSAVIAADGSTASGLESAVIAALTSLVTGNRSVALASEAATINGHRAAVLASSTCQVTGNDSAAIASDTTTVPGTQSANIASGGASLAGQLRTANIATSGAQAGDVPVSQNCANMATDSTKARGLNSAAIASQGTTVGDGIGSTREGAAVACYNGTVEPDRNAQIGCNDVTMPSTGNNNVVALASVNVNAATHDSGAPAPQYSVIGGNGTNGWRLEGASGNILASGTVAGGGLDVAEFFAALEAIPLGCFAAEDGDDPSKVRIARDGEEPQGITSANPTIVGGDDTFGWAHRTARGLFGEPLYDDVEVIAWRGYDGPAKQAPARPGAGVVEYGAVSWPGYDGPAARVPADRRPGEVVEYDVTLPCLRWPAYDGPVVDAPCAPPSWARTYRKFLRDRVSWPAFDAPAALAPPERPATAEEYTFAIPSTRWQAFSGRVDDAPCAPPSSAVVVPCVRWDGYDGPVADQPCAPPSGAKLRTEQRPRINPAYDRARQHTPRERRPEEWAKLGILGQFRLRVTADVAAGQRIVPTTGGHGRPRRPEDTCGGARVKQIVEPFDEARGYAVAWVYFNARS